MERLLNDKNVRLRWRFPNGSEERQKPQKEVIDRLPNAVATAAPSAAAADK